MGACGFIWVIPGSTWGREQGGQVYKGPVNDPLLLFSRSVFSDPFVTPWAVACQAPLPTDFPGKNTGVSCHFLLQVIFSTQGSNPCLLHRRADSLPLSHRTMTNEPLPLAQLVGDPRRAGEHPRACPPQEEEAGCLSTTPAP